MSVASEYDHAEQVVADVALLHDMAAGRLDEQRVKEAAQVLLEHRRHELPSVSVAVAARLLGVSRTTVDYADGMLAEALRQLRAGELGDEYVPSEEDLDWGSRELDDPTAREER